MTFRANRRKHPPRHIGFSVLPETTTGTTGQLPPLEPTTITIHRKDGTSYEVTAEPYTDEEMDELSREIFTEPGYRWP